MKRSIPVLATVAALTLGLAASCAKPARELQLSDTITPDSLAHVLSGSGAAKPVLFHVGFAPLYRSGHIPNSAYVGPASKPDGLDALRSALASVPADQPVVLYCGCCPWKDCPNVHPAFRAALASGHANVRVLYVEKTLQHDWMDRGFPVEKGE
jgi:hypothetical protein